jgi:hypothetical protein
MGVPTGQSGQGAIALVRAYSNELQYPNDATVLLFLNRGIEEVVRRIGGIRLWRGYPTVANQTQLILDDDIQDIVSANFSQGATTNSVLGNGAASPFSQGALIWPMKQYDQTAFFDYCQGFPSTTFGPPDAFFIYQDAGTAPGNALTPPEAPIMGLTDGQSDGLAIEVVTTYVNPVGETVPSGLSVLTPSVSQTILVASPPGQSNASGWNVYAGEFGGYTLQNASPLNLGDTFTLSYPLITGTVQPPSSNTAIGSGTGGELRMQIYPAASLGQVNVYYRARPQLWADASPLSWTNLDTSQQEAAIIFATIRTLQSRQRADEAKAVWQPEYEAMVADLKETVGKRIGPKSGIVRDVSGGLL